MSGSESVRLDSALFARKVPQPAQVQDPWVEEAGGDEQHAARITVGAWTHFISVCPWKSTFAGVDVLCVLVLGVWAQGSRFVIVMVFTLL